MAELDNLRAQLRRVARFELIALTLAVAGGAIALRFDRLSDELAVARSAADESLRRWIRIETVLSALLEDDPELAGRIADNPVVGRYYPDLIVELRTFAQRQSGPAAASGPAGPSEPLDPPPSAGAPAPGES